MSTKESIPCIVKGPNSVQHEEVRGKSIGRSGCSIIDLQFQHPAKIGELTFSNYYTAWISIYIKRVVKASVVDRNDKDSNNVKSRSHLERSFSTEGAGSTSVQESASTKEELEEQNDIHINSIGERTWKRRHSSGYLVQEFSMRPWELSVEMKTLMPSPHHEAGSQDQFSIPATESLVDWKDIVILRLVLYQPSTLWKKFYVDDLNVFSNLPKPSLFHGEELLKQRESWFSILIKNTKEVLINGQAILGYPNSDDES